MSTKCTNIQQFLNRQPHNISLHPFKTHPQPQRGKVTEASCPMCTNNCCHSRQLLVLCSTTFCKVILSSSACALDGVCDVEDKLHVHGSLWNTSTTSVDDGDQSAVQLVHVVLREQSASRASLVLHLRAKTHIYTHHSFTEHKIV